MPPAEILRTVQAARDKLAEEVVVLDLRGKSDVTDFFVVCHGNTDRHVQAIAENIRDSLSTPPTKLRPKHIEGLPAADWVLMDYVDFVVHVFVENRRKYYRLESLWGDAPQLALPDEGPNAPRRGADAAG